MRQKAADQEGASAVDREETFIQSRLIFVLFIAAVIFFAELSDILLLPTFKRIFQLDEELMDIIMAVIVIVPFI